MFIPYILFGIFQGIIYQCPVIHRLLRTIQLSDSSNSIDRALTMLPELVEKLTTLVKKDAKAPAEEPKAE